jgi:hypothetical protein
MRFVRKFNNFINESFQPDPSVVDDIVETVIDFIDDGIKIVFSSSSGDMSYSDYSEKNAKYNNFKPVIKGGNKIISKFKITLSFGPKYKKYTEALDLMTEMNTSIGRLGDLGWTLVDVKLNSNRSATAKEVGIVRIEYIFEKPDVDLEEEFKLPSEDELREKIEEFGIAVRDIDYEDGMMRVDFASYAYDGELNSEAWYDDKFEIVCDFFGFEGYDLQYQKAMVYFEYNY